MIFETHGRKRKVNNMFTYDLINTFYDINLMHTMVDKVDSNKYSEVMVFRKENEIDDGRLIFYQELDLPKVYKKD